MSEFYKIPEQQANARGDAGVSPLKLLLCQTARGDAGVSPLKLLLCQTVEQCAAVISDQLGPLGDAELHALHAELSVLIGRWAGNTVCVALTTHPDSKG